MHGLNYASISEGFERLGLDPTGLPPLIMGMRNLIPLSSPDQVFGRGKITQQQLRNLMRKLAIRIAREPDWPDKLPCATSNQDNPQIPSGYTYLLQLIAHDIVHTSISLAMSSGERFGFANSRSQALSLETVFGGGPDVCPHAYAFNRACRELSLPRTRLRVGRTQRNNTTDNMPFDDIGRGRPVDVSDDGMPASGRPMLTEACVADPRNDDHALISQLTVLFHRLHNLIMSMIEDGPVTSTPVTYRNFVCARLVSTLIYRKIIVWDVLQRLLDPSVLRYYVLDSKPLIASGKGVPVEFSHGAFRCGHAMIRHRYRVNGPNEEDTARALQLSSLRSPGFVPVTDTWTVSWKRFFELDETVPNYSRRIGPNFSPIVRDHWLFPPLRPNVDGDGDAAGLPNRDLVSAVYCRLWSVPALIDELRKNPAIAAFLPAYGALEKPLADWLNSNNDTSGISEQLTADDVATLAADPPLPFFVLFEAAFTRTSATMPFAGGGQHLGPLGSIIVAETIMDAIKQSPIGLGSNSLPFDHNADLKHQIAEACVQLGVDQTRLASIPDIKTMTDVLDFVSQQGVLAR